MSGNIKIGCTVLVLDKDGKLLFGKRKGVYGEGSWGLPGGHLEYGEKMIDAAKRELEEETGIKTNHLALESLVDDPRHDQHYIHITFKLDSFKGKVELKEPDRCGEWKFFSLDNLPEDIFIGHKRIIESFLKESLYLY